MTRIGFYSGSFDPVTLGHMDVINRATALADHMVIGIGRHPGKSPVFTVDERVALLQSETAPLAKRTGTAIRVETFDGLTVDAARRVGATIIVRGLRDGTDLDYEMQMAGMNQTMAPDISTVFVPASPSVRHITATLVRQIAQMGGDITAFVSADVAKQLEHKLRPRT
jgi:pantetheine-phosphate adenylyltransferase